MKRIVYKILPVFVIDLYIKKIKRPPCIKCEGIGVLNINDKEYICENCALIMSELSCKSNT
ncbi:hypothetical protein IGJ34_002357 [Enterococcus sp. AZ177]